jgi:hypothetical protein
MSRGIQTARDRGEGLRRTDRHGRSRPPGQPPLGHSEPHHCASRLDRAQSRSTLLSHRHRRCARTSLPRLQPGSRQRRPWRPPRLPCASSQLGYGWTPSCGPIHGLDRSPRSRAKSPAGTLRRTTLLAAGRCPASPTQRRHPAAARPVTARTAYRTGRRLPVEAAPEGSLSFGVIRGRSR